MTGEYALPAPVVPHHGGTPWEMLRDLARFLDGLDAAANMAAFTSGPHEGKTVSEVLRGERANNQTVQSDVRWLADWLEADHSGRSGGTDGT